MSLSFYTVIKRIFPLKYFLTTSIYKVLDILFVFMNKWKSANEENILFVCLLLSIMTYHPLSQVDKASSQHHFVLKIKLNRLTIV